MGAWRPAGGQRESVRTFVERYDYAGPAASFIRVYRHVSRSLCPKKRRAISAPPGNEAIKAWNNSRYFVEDEELALAELFVLPEVSAWLDEKLPLLASLDLEASVEASASLSAFFSWFHQ